MTLRRTLTWFQWRLRDLLALTTIAAVLLGWWLDRNRLLRQLAADREHHQDEILRMQNDVLDAEARGADLYAATAPSRARSSNWLALPPVSGLVTSTRTKENLVQINLGTDDGLKGGDRMDVFRLGSSVSDTRHLAEIELTHVTKIEAVATIVPGTQKGTIEKDDHVIVRPSRR